MKHIYENDRLNCSLLNKFGEGNLRVRSTHYQIVFTIFK